MFMRALLVILAAAALWAVTPSDVAADTNCHDNPDTEACRSNGYGGNSNDDDDNNATQSCGGGGTGDPEQPVDGESGNHRYGSAGNYAGGTATCDSPPLISIWITGSF